MTAEANGVAVVNLVSDNPECRWSLDEARAVLGYEPKDRGPDLLPPADLQFDRPRPLRALRRYLRQST